MSTRLTYPGGKSLLIQFTHLTLLKTTRATSFLYNSFASLKLNYTSHLWKHNTTLSYEKENFRKLKSPCWSLRGWYKIEDPRITQKFRLGGTSRGHLVLPLCRAQPVQFKALSKILAIWSPQREVENLWRNSETSTEAAEDKFSHNNSFQMGTNSESEAFKESACCDGCSKHGIYCLHTNLCEPYHCGSQCILGLLPSLCFVSNATIFGIGCASFFAPSLLNVFGTWWH